MNAPVPVSCMESDAIRLGMQRAGVVRVVEPGVMAIDFADGDAWVLTDYTDGSGEERCWHVADSARIEGGPL